MTEPLLAEAEHAVANLEDQIVRRGRRARRNQQVYDACAIPVLVALFVNRLLSDEGVHPSLSRAVRRDAGYIEVFGRIGAVTGEFAACLMAFDDAREPGPELADQLTTLGDELLSELDAALDAFVAAVNAKAETMPNFPGRRQSALRMVSGIRMRVRARQQIQRFERRSLEVLTDASAVRQERTRRYYTALELSARRTAEKLRLTVMILLGGATVVVLVLGLTTGEPVVRAGTLLLALVPVLMLAAYLALESSWHRLTERWARELANAGSVPPTDEPVVAPAVDPAAPAVDGPDALAVVDDDPDEPHEGGRAATGS